MTRPHGAPTESGYSDDLAVRESSRWPGLTLVRIGCPGISTQGFIDGGADLHLPRRHPTGDRPRLPAHPSLLTVLVTVDLGFNDVVRCLHHMEVKSDCVVDASRPSHRSSPGSWRRCGRPPPPGTRILGLGHYDPYLADASAARGAAFAEASLEVIERLDEVMRAAYAKAGIPMAEVGGAFDLQTPAR